MKKSKYFKRLVVALAAAFLVTPLFGAAANAYTVDNTYQLGTYEGSNQLTANNYIIAHDTGAPGSARNTSIFEKRTWNSNGAYVQYIVGDWGHVYRIGADGFVSWGAGSYANANAPVQIELAHTTTQAQFKVDYAVYVNLLRASAIKYGIPLTLDQSGRGIKAHKWVSDNIWGDHQDPYGYLASFGITKAQFARDLKTGLPENGSETNTQSTQQITPKVSTPKTSAAKYWYDNDGTCVTYENGYFTPKTYLRDWWYAGYSQSPYIGFGMNEATIHYFGYVVRGNYVYIAYQAYDGYVHYIAVRENGVPLGTFK
ncbi:peptidoglycan recognition protein family protein [Paucilactobacillus sp. N302-9]